MCLFKGHGFWFIYPNEPIDASEGSGMMALNEAKHTAIFEFNNNVAHSNQKVSKIPDRHKMTKCTADTM